MRDADQDRLNRDEAADIEFFQLAQANDTKITDLNGRELEMHGLNPAVIVLLNRTLDAEGAVAAAEDALARRQDSLQVCRQALRIGLSSMLRQQ